MNDAPALFDYPERRAVLRPGSFDRRAVARTVARIPVTGAPDAWSAVLDRVADELARDGQEVAL
jgi:hypothetical protein